MWLVGISLPLPPLSPFLSRSLFHSLSAASFCLFVLAQCVKVNLVKSLLFIISLPSSSASLALFELATCLPYPSDTPLSLLRLCRRLAVSAQASTKIL